MAAKRTNLTMPTGLFDAATERMKDQHYESFSEYVADLIRRDALQSRPKDGPHGLNEHGGGYGGGGLKKARCAITPQRPDFFVVTRKTET